MMRARHAYDALRETLQTMSAQILPEASITLPLLGACTTEEAMVASPEVAPRIRAAMASLARTLNTDIEQGPSFPLD
jgi:microcystin degradation protein MlrC